MSSHALTPSSSSSSSSVRSASRGLHVSLWVAQVLLALTFGAFGVMKLSLSASEVAQSPTPLALVRFIGASELAGALGLLLPALTRIRPGLVSLAALGLLIIMVLAALFHASRGELAAIGFNVLLGGLAAFVVWGRSRRAPIAPRR